MIIIIYRYMNSCLSILSSKELLIFLIILSYFSGIWAPPNRNTKAYALKLFFPNLSNAYKFLETLPTPFHIAIGYDAFKAREVMQLNERYPGQILNYGIFNNDIPSDAKLIAKTVEDFEKKSSPPN